MKPILYWTLTGSRYGHRYAAFAVTSEGPRNRINGRFADDHPSHTTKHDCTGRFETKEAAESKVAEIKVIRAKFDDARKPHNEAIRIADREESAEIEALLKVSE